MANRQARTRECPGRLRCFVARVAELTKAKRCQFTQLRPRAAKGIGSSPIARKRGASRSGSLLALLQPRRGCSSGLGGPSAMARCAAQPLPQGGDRVRRSSTPTAVPLVVAQGVPVLSCELDAGEIELAPPRAIGSSAGRRRNRLEAKQWLCCFMRPAPGESFRRYGPAAGPGLVQGGFEAAAT